MNTKVFRQYDSRWGKLPYPTSKSTVSSDGCGLCAVTHCAIEVKGNEKLTPKDVQPYMKQFAVAGNGTMYANPDGIAEGLKHYGLKDVKKFGNMADFWEEVKKGDRVGVILFWGGTASDGTVWTTGGHFVAFNKYEYKKNKHWLYTKDSGYRMNDGFHAYETSMRGLIGYLWTGRIPKEGWIKEDNNWYFYDDDVMVRNDWKQDSSGKWFYLGEDGKMLTSRWVKWRDNWYYLKENGEMASDEWAKDSHGKWFYLGSDGKMVKSKWIKWKEDWYYLDADGEMVTDEWQKDSKGWCYLGADGKMLKSSWIKYKDNWYYVDANGYMVTGKQNIGGKTYQFDKWGNLIE